MSFKDKYYLGVFWLPDSQENQFVSNLYIDKEGVAYLSSLFDFHKPNGNQSFPNWTNINLVYGWVRAADSGKQLSVKLYDFQTIFKSPGFLGFFKYQSSKVFISKELDEFKVVEENEKYKNIYLSSGELNDWIDKTGFKLNFIQSKRFESQHLYKQPKEIQLFEDENFKVCLFFRANATEPFKRKSSIEEKIFLNIDFKNDKSIKEAFIIKQSFDRIFSLLIGKPYNSTELGVTTKTICYYEYQNIRDSLSHSLRSPIFYNLFIENSQSYFENWFAKQEKLELFIESFFSVYGQKGVLFENRFLSYISVIENYHKNHIKKKSDLIDRIKYILENTSFSEKIQKIDSLAEMLKTTRHYHAHLEEKHKDKSFKSIELNQVNIVLENIIKEIALKEIGYEEKVTFDSRIIRAVQEVNKIVDSKPL